MQEIWNMKLCRPMEPSTQFHFIKQQYQQQSVKKS